ncbi:hypothetical protein [Niveispirillum fermenti]|uniref:hypothetical protein n=1 Tax=Niveispirillum fermenti TaxID=1233113 RepID=UPI003A8BBA41
MQSPQRMELVGMNGHPHGPIFCSLWKFLDAVAARYFSKPCASGFDTGDIFL